MSTRAKVNPRTQSPSHEISISDGFQTWGIRLEDGVRSIQETPITPSTLLINSQGGKFGDYGPSMSHVQQSSWIGGRGQERFDDDNTRYYDGMNIWTSTPDLVTPSLQWQIATGYRNQTFNALGTNYSWYPLTLANNIWLARQLTAGANYNVDKMYLWVKKIGTPADLTVLFSSESAGLPGSTLKTVTLAGSTVNENEALYLPFDFTGTQAVTSATNYWVIACGTSTDDKNNHWEVLTSVNSSSTDSKASLNAGVNWKASLYAMIARMCDADVSTHWKFFLYNSKTYAVSIPASGNSQLFEATAYSFTEIATTGLTVVSDVKVFNNIVYFAQGEATNIRRWNGSAWADDGTNKATYLYVYYDTTTNAAQLWRGNVATISRAPTVAWGTNLTFSTPSIVVGDSTNFITGMCGYNHALWVFKKDSVWSVTSDKPEKLDVGIDDALSTVNGQTSVAHGIYMFFSFVTSLERLYGTTLDDIGPGSHGAGLPANRNGSISALDSVMGTLFVAIDGWNDRYSSVMMFDGINYHEIWRAPEIGKRVRALKWQSRADDGSTNPVLWIDYGGDIIYIVFPKFSMHPTKDTTCLYAPEGHLITSTFDMSATSLKKFFGELTAITKNLGINYTYHTLGALQVANIGLDYQCDDQIGTSTWYPAGTFFASSGDTIKLNLGERLSIRFRFRLNTVDAYVPPTLLASVLEGVARTPVKYQWVLRGKFSSIQATLNGAPDHQPLKLMKWLKEKSASAERLIMHSTLATMDGKSVLVEPMSAVYEFATPTLKSLGGNIVIVLRET